MRRKFASELFIRMMMNPKIYVIVGDLGFGMFDFIRIEFPDRFINTGAAEQAMMGIAVGLAMEGKIPFVYSITPFLTARPYETIRNYINYENIPVKLVGAGRDKDYINNGFSHWGSDDLDIMDNFINIDIFVPLEPEEIPEILDIMIGVNEPFYINLKR